MNKSKNLYYLHRCTINNGVYRLRSNLVCPTCGQSPRPPIDGSKPSYFVWRKPNGDVACEVRYHAAINGMVTYPLKLVAIHGGEWNFGYGGSGPADLALSMLADHFGETDVDRHQLYTGDCECVHWHQRFKWRFLASQSLGDRFVITSDGIWGWIATQPGGVRLLNLYHDGVAFAAHAEEVSGNG